MHRKRCVQKQNLATKLNFAKLANLCSLHSRHHLHLMLNLLPLIFKKKTHKQMSAIKQNAESVKYKYLKAATLIAESCLQHY